MLATRSNIDINIMIIVVMTIKIIITIAVIVTDNIEHTLISVDIMVLKIMIICYEKW